MRPHVRFVAVLLVIVFPGYFLGAMAPLPQASAQTDKPASGDKGGKTDAAPKEDRQTWAPEKKADAAIQHLKDAKQRAEDLKKDDCADAIKDWNKWFDKAVEATSCWYVMKELRDKVKKNAPGPKVKEFKDAFGSTDTWEALKDDLIKKIEDCATKAKAKTTVSEAFEKITKRAEAKQAVEFGEMGYGPMVAVGCGDGKCPDKKSPIELEDDDPEEVMGGGHRDGGHHK